jgi:hypothetical protein
MDKPPLLHSLTKAELDDLRSAKALLEHPGFSIRLAGLLGSPVEMGFKLLPKGWSSTVNKATKSALLKALHLAVKSLGNPRQRHSREALHKVLAGASGGIGGALGVFALPVELPVSTVIMLRSIADIARSEGHDIAQIQTRLECLEVFAFGGDVKLEGAEESSYWITRTALAKSISEAATYLSRKGSVDVASPVVVKLVNSIAARFGAMVSEEIAAKAIPVIGAAGGGIVNVLFMAHFQEMARGHFIVKRLELKHGQAVIKALYEELPV